MQLLKDKKAVITGGTSGIGRQIALHFAKQGAHVIIIGTSEERAKSVCSEMQASRIFPDQDFQYRIVDIADFSEVEKVISEVLNDWSQIDILVNNAGITRDNLIIRMKEIEWDEVVNVNLKSVYNTCKIVVRPMMKAKAGKIINITSVVGLTGNAGQVNYAASKSGMIGFTKSLAKELAGRGICVNCIAPGYIQTRMTMDLPKQAKEAILTSIPMKRIGKPEDIADAAVFLASDQSSYITGQVLTVDGGMVM